MGKARVVKVRGPLAPYVTGFDRDLVGQGYRSTAGHLYVMAQVSRWLETKELAARDLTAALVEEFACWRKADGYVSSLSAPKMTALLTYLVDIGVVPAFEGAVAVTPVEVLMGRYTRYLLQERGLSTSSIRHYVDVAHAFLSWLPTDGELGLEALTTATVTGFVLAQCRRYKVASAKAMTTRLRSLLRFFYLEGLTLTALAPAVPTVASWRQGSLPKALTASDVARLLKSCDRRTTVGRRDFAVLVVLSRLGLRAGEVARLRLGDIDWRQGDLVVRGKANRQDRLPVPGDVGEAIVGWLQRGRPRCGCQSVFTRVRAPHRALSSGGISLIVWHACERAGLPPVGAHRLRHTAATQMLRAGGSLTEVGQVLRHVGDDTTSIYAKVDRRSLTAVVAPWPGGTT